MYTPDIARREWNDSDWSSRKERRRTNTFRRLTGEFSAHFAHLEELLHAATVCLLRTILFVQNQNRF